MVYTPSIKNSNMPFLLPLSSLNRAVAILTGPSTHLDHLGILSAVLSIPLIVTEESHYQLSKKYYPQINVQYLPMSDLSLDYLHEHFDTIFESSKFWTMELQSLFRTLYKKEIRFVFCPHGNSDKGFSLKEHPPQDICLIYGSHQNELLEKTGALQQIQHVVRTGNYRYDFYCKWRFFYDDLVEREIFSYFKKNKPFLLYAPTWQNKENASSFLLLGDEFLDSLSNDYNLIIKLHPFLIEDHYGKVLHLVERYRSHPSILIIEEFPPIYPLLNRCDLYLGDYSSIGYDFLAFDKPLYFYQPSGQSRLSRCGIEIPVECFDKVSLFLKATYEKNKKDLQAERQDLYKHVFG